MEVRHWSMYYLLNTLLEILHAMPGIFDCSDNLALFARLMWEFLVKELLVKLAILLSDGIDVIIMTLCLSADLIFYVRSFSFFYPQKQYSFDQLNSKMGIDQHHQDFFGFRITPF